MSEFELWFDGFYNSKTAQEFCFGNHNSAIRDEQVAVFSAQEAWDFKQKELNKLQSENTKLQNKLDLAVEALESVSELEILHGRLERAGQALAKIQEMDR